MRIESLELPLNLEKNITEIVNIIFPIKITVAIKPHFFSQENVTFSKIKFGNAKIVLFFKLTSKKQTQEC